MNKIRVFNGCSGFGANTFLLDRSKYQITHVEMFEDIADVTRLLNPEDEVIVGDAYDYFQKNHKNFDIAWFSPNCQRHSRMVKATRHDVNRIPDMTGLYGIIIFLQHFYKGDWIVENVVPFYKPLIEPKVKVGRHLLWSNKELFGIQDVKRPSGFINKATKQGADELKKWLGIHFEGYVYYKGNHCPAQTLRNCIHPLIGLQSIEQLIIN